MKVYSLVIVVVMGLLALMIYLSACNSTQVAAEPASPAWYDKLPDCPCENPDQKGLQTKDGWAIDKGDLSTYHPGATICYRSYPAVETEEGASGQQCCYDDNGELITGGSGAGTPDKVSTCKGEDIEGVMAINFFNVYGHLQKDVKPWNELGGWMEYNKLFPPNNGGQCKKNIVTVEN